MIDAVLSDPQARVIQGILTLAAAAVASATALWIAYMAYPKQKNLDRRLQKESERRDVYRKFLQAANGHFARLAVAHNSGSLEGLKDSYTNLVTVAADLAAYVPSGTDNDVLKNCQRYFQRLLEYGTVVEAECGDEVAQRAVAKRPERYEADLFREVQRERKRAFIAIRRDLGETLQEATHAADVYFVQTPQENEQ